MALEYGTSRKDAITPFSTSSAIVLIRVKELNPFNSGLDHVRSLRAKEKKGEVVILKLIKRRERS